ncbi:MAG: endolytic transglycosylase MltG [Desulfuromonadaceae bacterium]|nr:endolytic transglycosylase MltG [Desulfuromonadaceae bacterium]
MSRLTAILAGTVLVPLAALLFFAAEAHRFVTVPVAPPESTIITIPSGTSFNQAAQLLEQKGIISSARKLKILAHWQGSATRVKAGRYLFEGEAIPHQILERLVAGDVLQERLTIPEGWTAAEIARRIGESGPGKEATVLRLVRDKEFIRRLEMDVSSLEGYLFPSTYTFPEDFPVERLLETMVREFHSRLTEEMKKAAAERNLSLHQWVTLASIIQKEAGNVEEMPLIAAVFHNRLKKGMLLQADPTVIYGISDFDGNLTRRHLSTPTPYNTYQVPGLPPGPIANPGLDALKAAVQPAPVDYLFFVSRNDGTHVFSRTLREHNAAVFKYQKRRRR